MKGKSARRNHRNASARKNQLLFGITMIIFQIVISIVYGTMCNIQHTQLNISSVIAPIFLTIFATVGFGLHLSYFVKTNHLALAYCFLITALCIQFHPLINALWTKVDINKSTLYHDSFDNKDFSLFLATRDSTANLNNTITAAVKCSIAIIVALSSLIGRIGPLQCFILTIIGTIGYELNRQIINNYGQDIFGSFSIFTFGGFMGLTAGIITALNQKRRSINTSSDVGLIAKYWSLTLSVVGGLFLFIFFPYLAFEGEQSFKTSDFHSYTTANAIILSMCSAFCFNLIISSLVKNNGRWKPRQLSNSIIAGAITTGAASFYIVTPIFAFISGAVGGATQFLYQEFIDKQIKKKTRLISTYSFTVFCLQGLNGAIFAAGYNYRIGEVGSENFTFQGSLENGGYELIIYLISCGIGIVCGGIVGFFIYFLNKYTKHDIFIDKAQFFRKDHILNNYEKQVKPIQIPESKDPCVTPPSEPTVPVQGTSESQSQITQMEIQFFDMLQADFT